MRVKSCPDHEYDAGAGGAEQAGSEGSSFLPRFALASGEAHSLMSYFILGNDGQVEGPHPLSTLKSLLESGQITAVIQVCREGENTWVSLSYALQKDQPVYQAVQPVAQPAVQPVAQPQHRQLGLTEQQHLADIRSRSCYSTLRFVINVIAGIALAITIISMGFHPLCRLNSSVTQ